MSINFDIKYLEGFVEKRDFLNIEPEIENAHKILHSGQGVSKNTTGWLDLPVNYDKDEFERVKFFANRVRENSDILVVIGIGGSYLGAKSAIDFIHSPNYNLLKKDSPSIFFVGNNLSSAYISEIMDLCKNKRVSLSVISKSGLTTEPAVAFRVFKKFMEENFGKEDARNRIFCTTGKKQGNLIKMALEEGYETFTVPDNIGGRFSVLSSVGLFPIAVSGANTDNILLGAKKAMEKFMFCRLDENACYKYAAARNILYRKGKLIEILAAYEPGFSGFLEWWKQLYGESEGKDQKGIFPSSLLYSTDLHSMGQFVQEGSKVLFETNLALKKYKKDIIIEENKEDDGLDFLEGKSVFDVNRFVFEATSLAHYDGNVPGMTIEVDDNSEEAFGYLTYFFEKSCAMSALILGVNPFNQPGVEAYKRNMFAFLGKPGYEDLKTQIAQRLNYS